MLQRVGIVRHAAVNTSSHITTRASLLARLKDLEDQKSWRDFFDTYWRLIYNVAIKAGLTDPEAQDVVQETLIAVVKKMPGFEYVPGRDSFKGWLLQITRWKIADQFRKRLPTAPPPGIRNTEVIEGHPDPAGSLLDSIWDEEWKRNALTTALDHLKKQVNPQHYEIFKLHVFGNKSAQEVAKRMGVSADQVYVIKHRVAELLKKAIKRMETKVV